VHREAAAGRRQGDAGVDATEGDGLMDWRHQAACLDEDSEMFFPVGNGGPAILQTEQAKDVCRRCDVVETCLRWALDTGQDAGIWGGLSEDERRKLKRRESRAGHHLTGEPEPQPAPPTPRRSLSAPRGALINASVARTLILRSGLSNVALANRVGLTKDVIRKIRSGEQTLVRETTLRMIMSGVKA
jgi:WhiB family redox-sensing transcriptional regulator